MDFDDKMELCNQAYDIIRKLWVTFVEENDTDNERQAADVCQKIMTLQMSILRGNE